MQLALGNARGADAELLLRSYGLRDEVIHHDCLRKHFIKDAHRRVERLPEVADARLREVGYRAEYRAERLLECRGGRGERAREELGLRGGCRG